MKTRLMSTNKIKARNRYLCLTCNEFIEPSEEYIRANVVITDDGDGLSHPTQEIMHCECFEDAKTLWRLN
jgi:hypothetical protein